MFITLTSTFIIFPPLTRITFFPIKSTFTFHDISFVKIYDSFIPVIMFNTLRFKSSVFLGTNILLDKPLRVLQLPTLQSNLSTNG